MPTPPARYQQIAQHIERQIRAGELPTGSSLPAVSALARQHSVSQMTVKHALALLVQQGLVATARGVRAVVLDADPIDPRDVSARLDSIEADLVSLTARTLRLEHARDSTQTGEAHP